jgi:predicted GIY-YIG superfamily endonuclease
MISGMENTNDRLIYAYEFSDNHVYIGLTQNLKERIKSRRNDKDDAVTKYENKTKLIPIIKIIHDFINYELAGKLEIETIENYKLNGWEILNISKGGGLGGNYAGPRKWTIEKIKESALKYETKSDWHKYDGTSYDICLKYYDKNFFKECTSHMIKRKKIVKNKKWTPEKIKESGLKYQTKAQWNLNESSAYSSALNLDKLQPGFFKECTQHMLNGLYHKNLTILVL